MSTFIDAMLVRLSSLDGLRRLVFPTADPDRAKALLGAVYDVSDVTLHGIADVTVHEVECQRPLYPAVRRTGNWLQTIPTSTRADFTVEGATNRPQWIDLVAELTVTAVVEADPGGLESFTTKDIGEFATLAEFHAKVPGLDLPAFMARHHLSTVEDLRDAFRYRLGELQLKPRPPFDPADPANQRAFPLTAAVLVRDALDLAGALRDVRLTGRPGLSQPVATAAVTAAHAPVLVLPEGVAGGSGLTAAQITDFLASQRVLAVFEQP